MANIHLLCCCVDQIFNTSEYLQLKNYVLCILAWFVHFNHNLYIYIYSLAVDVRIVLNKLNVTNFNFLHVPHNITSWGNESERNSLLRFNTWRTYLITLALFWNLFLWSILFLNNLCNATKSTGPSCSKGGYRYPLDKAQLVSLTIIRWIVIYPVDSAIQLLNNWGLMYNFSGIILVA